MIGLSISSGGKPDKHQKAADELDTRIRHLRYAGEDYDGHHGKGKFEKDHKTEHNLLGALMSRKVKLAAAHADGTCEFCNESKADEKSEAMGKEHSEPDADDAGPVAKAAEPKVAKGGMKL